MLKETEDFPLGLREQLEGIRAGKESGTLFCGWCHRVIEPGEEVTMYAERDGKSPWSANHFACAECNDTQIGVPTKGHDEYMVRVRVDTAEKYKKQLWVEFDDAEILDHSPPTEGKYSSPEEADEWINSESPPYSKKEDRGELPDE